MLLWHDSLDYRSGSLLAARYTTASGFFVTGTHPQSGKKSLQTLGNSATLVKQVSQPDPNAGGAEVCIIGMLFWASLYPTSTGFAFIDIQTAGSAVQVRVRAVPVAGKTVLQFFKANDQLLLHQSSAIDFTTARYIELVVRIGTSGYIELYIDGVLDSRADYINTQPNTSSYWAQVQIIPASSGLNSFARIADLYIADAVIENGKKTFSKPLGRVMGTRLAVGSTAENSTWAPTSTFGNKYRLIVLAGSNNNHGRGQYPVGVTPPWRPFNTSVQIWRRSGTSYAFAPLQAGVNTYGFFLTGTPPAYWGPEMMLAEKIASLFESAEESASPNVRIIKLCQDSSLLDEVDKSPQYSWLPTQTGSLYQQSMSQLNAAATALGGWSAVDSIDFFWHQGETESLSSEAVSSLPALTTSLFNKFQTDIPVTIRFTRVLLSKKINAPTYYEIERVRNILSASTIPGSLIEMDEFPLQDSIHFTNQGYNALGEKYFEIWKNNLPLASYLSDYFTLSAVDSLYIASGFQKSATFNSDKRYKIDLVNSPALAVNCKFHADSTTFGDGFDSPYTAAFSLGPVQVPATLVPETGIQAPYSSATSQVVFPESLSFNTIKIETL